MATGTLSNHFKYQLANKLVNMDTDTFKLILMATGFTFNKDTHAVLADVSASELAHANGYIAAITLANSTVTEDDSADKAVTTFDDVSITASGGAIGPTPGAIIYDDTTSDDTIVGYIAFSAEITTDADKTLLIQDIVVNIA